MQFQEQIDIAAPIDKVFRNLTDPAYMTRWDMNLRSFEYQGGTPENRQGASYIAEYEQKNSSSGGRRTIVTKREGQVTGYRKNLEFSTREEDKVYTIETTLRLESSAMGTRVYINIHTAYRNAFLERILQWISFLLTWQIRARLKALKRYSEKDIDAPTQTMSQIPHQAASKFKITPRHILLFILFDCMIGGIIFYYWMFYLVR